MHTQKSARINTTPWITQVCGGSQAATEDKTNLPSLNIQKYQFEMFN